MAVHRLLVIPHALLHLSTSGVLEPTGTRHTPKNAVLPQFGPGGAIRAQNARQEGEYRISTLKLPDPAVALV
jgi:hypothetical protein